MIDAFCSEPHYIDHVAPIWRALGAQSGHFYVGDSHELARYAKHLDLRSVIDSEPRTDEPIPTIIASHYDYRLTPKRRPLIWVEHGVGQTYKDIDHAGYSGGPDRERVVLFLCPSARVVELNRGRYPKARSVAVGSPRLDGFGKHGASDLLEYGTSRATIAISFHWDCGVAPETRTTAWRYLPIVITALSKQYDVIGHGHPKILNDLRPSYEAAGIPIAEHFDEILERADLFVCDNSSALYEFAATGRPVLCLNGPGYRRNVEHGLRFWSHPPGLQCDTPDELLPMVRLALDDTHGREIREKALRVAYSALDGKATERAVRAIREVFV